MDNNARGELLIGEISAKVSHFAKVEHFAVVQTISRRVDDGYEAIGKFECRRGKRMSGRETPRCGLGRQLANGTANESVVLQRGESDGGGERRAIERMETVEIVVGNERPEFGQKDIAVAMPPLRAPFG